MSSLTTVSGQPRVSPAEIILSPMTEADLPAIASTFYESFPAEWWAKHEPPSKRPPEHIRIARMAKRHKPFLRKAGARFTVARVVSTGEVVGFAGWQQTPASGGPIMNLYRRAAVDELRFAEQEGWTQEEVREMWEAVDTESWDADFAPGDATRKENMGDEPHWYLGPLYVVPKWQGYGIGSMLMRDAFDIADLCDPPQPLYHEAVTAAMPVYAHLGYEPMGSVQGLLDWTPMIRRGPRQILN